MARANIIPADGPPTFPALMLTLTGKVNPVRRKTPTTVCPRELAALTVSAMTLPSRRTVKTTLSPGLWARTAARTASGVLTGVPSIETRTSPARRTPMDCDPLGRSLMLTIWGTF